MSDYKHLVINLIHPDLVTRVRQQKALARRNQTVRNRVLLLGIAIGLIVSVAWLVLVPTDGPKPQNKILIGFTAGFMLGVFILHVRESALFPQQAACPTCGHSWEIKEGRTVPQKEHVPTWDRCPGCGSLMNEVLLANHIRTSAKPDSKF